MTTLRAQPPPMVSRYLEVRRQLSMIAVHE
jgi:hypothetical protein